MCDIDWPTCILDALQQLLFDILWLWKVSSRPVSQQWAAIKAILLGSGMTRLLSRTSTSTGVTVPQWKNKGYLVDCGAHSKVTL